MDDPARPLTYVCDGLRHLVCVPYSVENLHRMARELGLGRHWFHSSLRHPHYDIPVRRRVEIEKKCRRVRGRDILLIMAGDYSCLEVPEQASGAP